GADFVATGHYVRKLGFQDTLRSPSELARSFPRLALPRKLGNHTRSGRSVPENEFPHSSLLKAKDGNKDQSYFLWRLGQKQLSRVIFPLGNYTKPQVREIARKAGLPTAAAKESQNLCFVGNDIVGFLKKHLKMKPGLITDKSGKIIGKHLGLGLYTIGQSQGFGANIFPKEQSKGPYFVLRKEVRKNLLVVTKNKKDLLGKDCLVKEVNWISGKMPVLPLRVSVKIRSQQAEMPAVVSKTKKANQFLIRFLKPQSAITPGQSAVFYHGEELVGGGIILTSNF
ncbi:MAG: hypothetical protein Q8N56_00915, partial [bacterium]|nr:hypothetical protein [bacterium]